MRTIRLVTVLLILSVRRCITAIITPESAPTKHSILAEAAGQILSSCYGNQGDGVVFAGPWNKYLEMILSRFLEPAIVLDNTTRNVENDPVNRDSVHKLKVLVVTATSANELASVLENIRKTAWWNHMASVLILDGSESNRGCAKATAMLKRAWLMNLLGAKFLCLDRTRRSLVYSYNPYTSRAPHPWKLVTTYRREQVHPWSLLVRGYIRSDEICDELDFAKTNDLGGHEIRVLVKNVSGAWITDPNKNGTEAFGGVDGGLARLFFDAFNATPKVVTFNMSYIINFMDDLIGDENGDFDIGLNARFPRANITVSYIIRESGICAMTQYRGYVSQTTKIFGVMERDTRNALLFVILISFLFFKYVMKQTWILAFLDVLRIICNMGIQKNPKDQAPRLYLAGLLMLMSAIQALYQGSIFAVITERVAIPDVKTIHDIINLRLTVYAGRRYIPFFKDSVFGERFQPIYGANCTEHVLNDYWAACLHAKEMLFDTASRSKLHVSDDPIVRIYRMYFIRQDWPPVNRFNTIIRRLVEAGIVQWSDMDNNQRIMHRIEAQKDLLGDQAFKVMTLENMTFAFVLLAIGFALSTICLILEIYIPPACLRNVGRKIAKSLNATK